MDAVSVIVSTFALGAGTGLTATAEVGIKDAYAAFKALVLRKLGHHEEAAKAVAEVEKKPDSSGRKEVLKEALTEAGAHQDQEVVDKATELLKLLEGKSPGVTGGLVGQINAAGGKVLVLGTSHGNNYM